MRYKPSVEVLISKKALLENLKEYKKTFPKFLFAPVLKSNAYGHGLVEVAKILDKEKIAFLVLDSLHEAMVLRNEGVKSKILIVGFTQTENIKNCKLADVSFTLTGLEQLWEVSSAMSKNVKIHLKVDTGMHRQGILPEQIDEAVKILKNSKYLQLEGVCSHFADADNDDEAFTRSQIAQWEKAVASLRENFPKIKYFHISATAGTFYCGETCGNVVRLGLGLYGINPSPFLKPNLKPVLKMQSIVSSLKKLPTGEHVGYNATYETKKPSTIATVPIGYFEGVDRRLSNCGFFKIGNAGCPIIGRVSMNITSVDVSFAPDVKLGDKITIISDSREDKNSAENIAKLTGAIPWEILVHIPQHLRRTVMED